MPATLMDSKQDAVSFPVPLLIYLHFQKSNTRVCLLNSSTAAEEPGISFGVAICVTHSRVRAPPLLPSPLCTQSLG